MEFNKIACKNNTPLFNNGIFAAITNDYYTLKFDDQFLIRSLETILYPGSKITVLTKGKKNPSHFLQVKVDDYPSDKELFIHEQSALIKNAAKKIMPSLAAIQKKLRSLEGLPYFWGGTLATPLFGKEHPFKTIQALTPFERKCFSFEGLDCSGLLYHVTNGATPRNTSYLMHLGTVCEDLRPLDLLLWQGHVVIVLDENHTIEAREIDGVVIEDLEKRLSEIHKERVWVKKIHQGQIQKKVYTTRRFFIDKN